MTTKNQDRLLSHSFTPKTFESTAERIKQQGDKPYVSVAKQLELLHQLNEFEFGRYILQNQGINGFWTHYMLTHPWFGKKTGKNKEDKPLSELESFILNRSPIMLATQQRFEIFLKENQSQVKNNAKLACIPCGMMGELLYLDFKNIEKISCIGIDYDAETFIDAASLADKKNLSKFVTFQQQDAWDLSVKNEFDLISSNGLTIYESDDNKVAELYRKFYDALKNDGKLVTSFLTPPPHLTEKSEWDFSHINKDDLLFQKILLVDIVEVKFQCFRSSEKTHQQLSDAGFKNIKMIYDDAKIFPTVVAYK